MKYRLLVFCFLSSLSFLHAQDGYLTFSHQRGFYKEIFDLTITSRPTDSIFYTLDGTDPRYSQTAKRAGSTVLLNVNPAETASRDNAPGFCVRAVAIFSDSAVTPVMTHTYLFVDKVVELSPDGQEPGDKWLPQNMSGGGQFINYGMDPQVCNSSQYRDLIADALLAVPSFSMVMNLDDLFDPGSGIYVNALERGIEWEKPCSIELLYPDGKDGFQINAGVRIRGGWSRNDDCPKRAFRWFFRNQYGSAKLQYPLFGDEGIDEFDHIDLRTSMNYSWSYAGDALNTMNRDVFSRDCQRDMGQPYTRSRYYHLYINGTYWGLYQTQERSEASFGASYFGGEADDYDVVKVNIDEWQYDIEATDGTLDAWHRLWQASFEGFESDEKYYHVLGCNPDGTRNPDKEVLVDVDNLIDYMLITFIVGDYDGPISNFRGNNDPNNFYAIYNRMSKDRGFMFFRHDAEHSMRNHEWGYDRTGPFPAGSVFQKSNPQWMFQQLAQNPHFRTRIADRVYVHFFDNGELTSDKNISRFLSRKIEIDLAIIAESARWGDSRHEPAYTRDNAWLPAISWIVDEFFPSRTDIVLDQLIAKGWFPQVLPPKYNTKGGRVEPGFVLTMTAQQGDIYYTTDGSDPFIPEPNQNSTEEWISPDSELKVLVPNENIATRWRSNVDFDDSDWQTGRGGVGYERENGYQNLFSIDVESEMYENQTSCFIRIPFTVKQKPDDLSSLILKMRYDDGFVAYLNGIKVAEANAPSSLVYNSAATGNHEADQWENFNITNYLDRMKIGDNLLAVHALNVNLTSSDFLASVSLVAGSSSNSGTVSENAHQYTAPLNIDRSLLFRARAVNFNTWSALNQIQLLVPQGLENLQITEIHYHPLDYDSTGDDGDFEFIELKNIGSSLLDLSDVYFDRGIQFQFPPAAQLQPGHYLVLASNDSSFYKRYGFFPSGEYSGQLDNGGETLQLVSASHIPIITLTYGDDYPWPRSADGSGFSLNILPDRYDFNDPKNWAASGKIHGTPGSDDPYVLVTDRSKHMLPGDCFLYPNFPNPFNQTTRFRFYIPRRSHVTLNIYNLLGQNVDCVYDRFTNAGVYELAWDASSLSSGVYIFNLKVGDIRMTRKLLLLK
ncbi:CotH kinase family protein [candidate division KSB1 bacterium]|nr:CotH kinase family protein [candidate division KSB1 bacterium]